MKDPTPLSVNDSEKTEYRKPTLQLRKCRRIQKNGPEYYTGSFGIAPEQKYLDHYLKFKYPFATNTEASLNIAEEVISFYL